MRFHFCLRSLDILSVVFFFFFFNTTQVFDVVVLFFFPTFILSNQKGTVEREMPGLGLKRYIGHYYHQITLKLYLTGS